MKNMKAFSDVYAGKQDYKNAYLNLSTYISIKDSLFNEVTHKQISELQTRYDTEKKEKTLKEKEAKIQKQKQ